MGSSGPTALRSRFYPGSPSAIQGFLWHTNARAGLHHLCLRARSREDVDRLHKLLRQIGATIIQGPQEGTWAPGYYSVLFEDPTAFALKQASSQARALQPGVKFNASSGYST